jgi:hypothetical protein
MMIIKKAELHLTQPFNRHEIFYLFPQSSGNRPSSSCL